MKTILLSTIALLTTAGSAMAGGPIDPPAPYLCEVVGTDTKVECTVQRNTNKFIFKGFDGAPTLTITDHVMRDGNGDEYLIGSGLTGPATFRNQVTGGGVSIYPL